MIPFHGYGEWPEPHGRFRGNASPVLEEGLAGLLRVGQDLGVHMDYHLVPLARGTGIEPVVEGALGQ